MCARSSEIRVAVEKGWMGLSTVAPAAGRGKGREKLPKSTAQSGAPSPQHWRVNRSWWASAPHNISVDVVSHATTPAQPHERSMRTDDGVDAVAAQLLDERRHHVDVGLVEGAIGRRHTRPHHAQLQHAHPPHTDSQATAHGGPKRPP